MESTIQMALTNLVETAKMFQKLFIDMYFYDLGILDTYYLQTILIFATWSYEIYENMFSRRTSGRLVIGKAIFFFSLFKIIKILGTSMQK